jgi:hypothetical protein
MKISTRKKTLGIVFSIILIILIISVLTPALGIKNKTISGINTYSYGYGYDDTCRFTGGGTIGPDREPRKTHGFELHCSIDDLPNRLEVNFGGDHFHMDVLTYVECSDDPAIDPIPPVADCDTIHGHGEGKFNGVSGYYVEFTFNDAGEPGKDTDWGWIKVTNSGGGIVMEYSGLLISGNHQSHC